MASPEQPPNVHFDFLITAQPQEVLRVQCFRADCNLHCLLWTFWRGVARAAESGFGIQEAPLEHQISMVPLQ